MARLDPRLFLVRRVINAIAGLDIDLVAAITVGQRDLLGPMADGVRTEQDVPLTEILRECDAVIAHGGAGTVLTASACGVPGLFVPQLPDHAAHARQLQAAGAGIVLSRETLTAERIRQGLQALLERPDYRVAAGELREAMAARPVPDEIVRTLEEVARAGRASEPS
jgi:UDP:flavonoid glycosyltransferase YjiC (YdhE family)